MKKAEFYIKKIIDETGLTTIEIQELITEKQDQMKGLISEEGALFVISKELGVDIKESEAQVKEPELKIKDINNGQMKNIIIYGKIARIFDLREFTKKDGSIGYVQNFIIEDDTGRIRVVLWDDKTEYVDDPQFELDRLIEVHKAYSKWSDYNNAYELILSNWGEIRYDPDKADVKKYPIERIEPIIEDDDW